MSYKITLGNPEDDRCRVVARDTLGEALHWLGDNWPLNAHDMAASIFFESEDLKALRICAIAAEGVVDIAVVRTGVRLLTTAIDAAAMP